MKKDIKKLADKYGKEIKSAGFSHIKVELEAQLARRTKTVRIEECANCTGNGTVHLKDNADNEYDIRCATCTGTGGVDKRMAFGDEDWCKQYLMEQLPEDLQKAFTFFYFYNDGSVDSELTFTIPVEHAYGVLEVIKAWKKLAEENGNGMNVDGAGMHISVLPSGSYPTRHSLDGAGYNNFVNEVTKLLPSLILLGTEGERTRRLAQYRSPGISASKYNAIHAVSGGFEYRLFDTCYEKPDTFITYMGLIAKTLEFYKDPTKKVESKKTLSYQFHETEYKTESLVDDEAKIEYVKNTIKYVKPADFSIKELMEERGVSISKIEFRKKNAGRLTELKSLYTEYRKVQENKVLKEANEHEANSIRYYRDNKLLANLEDKEILMLLRGMPDIEAQEQWINRNSRTKRGSAINKVSLTATV